MKTKINLGVGPQPFHPQHMAIMTNIDEWILVDKYVRGEGIENWDAEDLTKVGDQTMEVIYASHLLEHIPHPRVPLVLYHWFRKLVIGGKLILNVPDMNWVAKQIRKYEFSGNVDSDVFTTFNGHNSLQDIIYGTHAHEGEQHQSGYTKKSLTELLTQAGYQDIDIQESFDAHHMGVLISQAFRRTRGRGDNI